MKKATQLKSLLVSMAIASSAAISFAPVAVQAGASANFGATTNYIWRGWNQSGNVPAVSGGLDYGMDSGVYVGTWVSTTGSDTAGSRTNQELDVYGGFSGSVSDIDYDIGYIYYAYPSQTDADFSEIYGSVGFSGATVGINYTVSESWAGAKTGDMYLFGSYDYSVNDDVSVGVLFGNQSFAESGSDSYSHAQLSVAYKDFTVAYDKAMGDGAPAGKDSVNGVNTDGIISLSYSVSFDL